MSLRIVLLSPYDGLSHRYWRLGLGEHLERNIGAEIAHFTLPARHFSWRQRGNSLTWALNPVFAETIADLVIATSMTDLSALRGMRKELAGVPAIVYFHENQFAYPDSHPEGLVERQMTSVYTALAADRLVFNSQYNLESFLAGAGELLKRMPDGVPAGVAELLASRAEVIPVALEQIEPPERKDRKPGEPLRIVWNHRWEHDKGPARLVEIIRGLIERNCNFEMSLLGQQFNASPSAFEEAKRLLAEAGRLGQLGFVDEREDYLAVLASHDVVLSTAEQEFQGLAVQEAIQQGCLPVVPDDLAYPAYVPSNYRYGSVRDAVDLIATGLNDPQAVDVLLHDYSWDSIGPRWIQLVRQLLSRAGHPA